MRLQYGMLMWLCIALCGNVLKSTSKYVEKYECTIRKLYNVDRKQIYLRWAGVILNSKFVLSADVFEGKEEYDINEISVEMGIDKFNDDYIGGLNRSKRATSFKQTNVVKMWVFDSLLLLKTKDDVINLLQGARSIELPDAENWKAWMNTFAIPNNEVFSTSYWYRVKQNFQNFLKIIQKKRECSRDICYRENGLIPGCFKMEPSPFLCTLRAGGPLVYGETLVGIRKYTQTVAPHNYFPEDYFINVAFHTGKILYLTEEMLNCHH